MDDVRISDDEVQALIRGPCFFCGRAGPGVVDCVEPRRGYVVGNVVGACVRDAHLKLGMTLRQFVAWIKRLEARRPLWQRELRGEVARPAPDPCVGGIYEGAPGADSVDGSAP